MDEGDGVSGVPDTLRGIAVARVSQWAGGIPGQHGFWRESHRIHHACDGGLDAAFSGDHFGDHAAAENFAAAAIDSLSADAGAFRVFLWLPAFRHVDRAG